MAARARKIGQLFTDLGWPPVTVDAIKTILYRVADIGSLRETYEAMRRDENLAVLFGLPRPCWRVLLRLVLGSPQDPYALTDKGKGILLRIELGEAYNQIAYDDWLTFEIFNNAPAWTRTSLRTDDVTEAA